MAKASVIPRPTEAAAIGHKSSGVMVVSRDRVLEALAERDTDIADSYSE